ncbi:hypothetical protein HOLleu_25149 [Holothuria leucospilota]|uniref:Uncharacterized protein n=1 Tax=Holothuria leucospilota TaxID=206669 RepID=A0A9Q1BSE9_HOLLE|nr:hypothetical protein HOLleu_25149 [Holothuria leucospilota]
MEKNLQLICLIHSKLRHLKFLLTNGWNNVFEEHFSRNFRGLDTCYHSRRKYCKSNPS